MCFLYRLLCLYISIPQSGKWSKWKIKIFDLWYKGLDMGFIPFRLRVFLGTLKLLTAKGYIYRQKKEISEGNTYISLYFIISYLIFSAYHMWYVFYYPLYVVVWEMNTVYRQINYRGSRGELPGFVKWTTVVRQMNWNYT